MTNTKNERGRGGGERDVSARWGHVISGWIKLPWVSFCLGMGEDWSERRERSEWWSEGGVRHPSGPVRCVDTHSQLLTVCAHSKCTLANAWGRNWQSGSVSACVCMYVTMCICMCCNQGLEEQKQNQDRKWAILFRNRTIILIAWELVNTVFFLFRAFFYSPRKNATKRLCKAITLSLRNFFVTSLIQKIGREIFH